MYMWVQVSESSEKKSILTPGAGVSGGYEPLEGLMKEPTDPFL